MPIDGLLVLKSVTQIHIANLRARGLNGGVGRHIASGDGKCARVFDGAKHIIDIHAKRKTLPNGGSQSQINLIDAAATNEFLRLRNRKRSGIGKTVVVAHKRIRQNAHAQAHPAGYWQLKSQIFQISREGVGFLSVGIVRSNQARCAKLKKKAGAIDAAARGWVGGVHASTITQRISRTAHRLVARKTHILQATIAVACVGRIDIILCQNCAAAEQKHERDNEISPYFQREFHSNLQVPN